MVSRSIELRDGWRILQDVHDAGETLGLFRFDWDPYRVDAAVSPWEPIPRLAHLQLLLADQPYFGRELRSFNEHPWWYRLEFDTPDPATRGATLRFEGVDYLAKVWLNERLLGEHEGYFEPFEFEVGPLLRADRPNLLVVKVASPWDADLRPGGEGRRAFTAVRNLIKGTYEHADTFIQRDVNPVGIWRPVRLVTHDGLRPAGKPVIDTSLRADGAAEVSISWPVVVDGAGRPVDFGVRILSDADGRQVAAASEQAVLNSGRSVLSATLTVERPRFWTTWDRGEPALYRAELCVEPRQGAGWQVTQTFGIRTVELRRDERETTFVLNGRPLFLRGTSYFPDVYLSALDRARYERDLSAMVCAGVNGVRVHVHVENDPFYELCDRLGLAVIQDGDLNWYYPSDERFCHRAVASLQAMIARLRNHPAVICWICQNEPMERARGPLHAVSPGPQLEQAARRADPARPVIRSSDVDGPSSGDSHNWAGALDVRVRHYTAIRGTSEKLNTEFGFDAPPAPERLRALPMLARRLAAVLPRVAELHDYQYRLVKYFIEHYRRQKYAPCAGYFQFMWIDLSPQSFYGLYDWWGLPKIEGLGGGLRALREANLPVGVFLDCEASPATIWAVNDTLADLGECVLSWLVRGEEPAAAVAGSLRVAIGPDSRVRAGELELPATPEACREVVLVLRGPDGALLARNTYPDPLVHPPHPAGHPERMDHELGMRLYWA
jgi:beta-mannosidase